MVKLQSPDSPPDNEPNLIPRVSVDEVYYDDLDPWPTSADGEGMSLQRIAANTLGTYADSWRGEIPTPGNVPDRAAVESVMVNDGATGRSVVTSVTVQFDREVQLTSSAFLITHRETNSPVQSLNLSTTAIAGKTQATITFGTDPMVVKPQRGQFVGRWEL